MRTFAELKASLVSAADRRDWDECNKIEEELEALGKHSFVANLMDMVGRDRVRSWWFAPLYGKYSNGGPPDIVYAISLDQAFVQARRSWPTAQGWRCLGTVNPKNSEKATKRDAGWTERVVRTREETL